MKLKDFDTVAACNAGAELELRNPFTDVPSGRFITLLGVDSATFEAAQRRSFDARTARGDATFTLGDVKAEKAALFADCTCSWRIKDDEGKDVPFSRDAAVKLYTDYPRIMEQVNAFIGGLANFRRD